MLWGGDRLINNDTSKRTTLGICGTYNGQKAFLTCGHSNEKVNSGARYPYIRSYSTDIIGQVSYQRANTSSAAKGVNALGDFAIVTITNSNYTTTNIVHGLSITGTYSSLPEGSYIYKYGATSGLSYGTITRAAISTATHYGNYYVCGLYQSSMRNDSGTHAIDEGDSGGPVFVKSGSNYLLHGIVTARKNPKDGEVASVMYSTPIYFAVDAGFTVKTSN